jgi:serine protease Do
MKKISFLMFALVCTGYAMAQPPQEKPADKLGDFDEIIIKPKAGSKKASIKIELKDGDVIINGQPLTKFIDENITVKIKKKDMALSQLEDMNPEDIDEIKVFGHGLNVKVKKPFLGVSTTEDEKGALIEEVIAKSGAEKAGLKEGDIITKVNADKVTKEISLDELVKKLKVNDEATITYLREGKELTAKVKISNNPNATVNIQRGMSMPPNPPMGRVESFNYDGPMEGFGFDKLDKLFKSFDNPRGNITVTGRGRPKLGFTGQDIENSKGVKVTEIKKESMAEKAGLKLGDIITEINGEPVFDMNDLQRNLRAIEDGDDVKIKLTRSNKTENIVIKVPKKIETIDF